MKVNFVKMTAAGNDFIFIDNYNYNFFLSFSKLARSVCSRRTSVGADGLVVLERSKRCDAKMRIFNSDGSEAEMCGNAIRCFGIFAYSNGIRKKDISVETLSGEKKVHIKKNSVVVNMGKAKNCKLNIPLKIKNKNYILHHVNTGVPHTVLFVPDISKADVNNFGSLIRYHKFFGQAGTNVDFIEIAGKHKIKMRVYERGVEAETLACGTGATASAFISNKLGKTIYPIQIITANNEIININCKKDDLFMDGPVKLICKGEIYI